VAASLLARRARGGQDLCKKMLEVAAAKAK
jgi:hypothetical protein